MLRQMKIPEDVIKYLVDAYPATLDPKLRYIVWLGKQALELAKRENGGQDPRKSKREDEIIGANRAWLRTRFYPMDRRSIMQLMDWAIQTSPDLMRMTWEEAWNHELEWREELVADMDRQKTERYTDPAKVVFRTSSGWTINKLAPDDCVIEGDLMGHCVGGYARAVATGRTEIYSLRDPKGNPHATIEIVPTTNRLTGEETQINLTVIQIQGKSNHEPIDEYKEMLKIWFEDLQEGGYAVKWEYEKDFADLDYIRDWAPATGETDEYGIHIETDDPLAGSDWDDMIERAWKESWTERKDYFYDDRADLGVDAIFRNFEWNIKDKDEEAAKHTFDELEKAAQKFDEKANDEWSEYESMNWEFLPHYPDEMDFEDEETGKIDSEKFEEAEKEYYKNIGFYIDDFSYFKFNGFLWKKLNEMRGRFYPQYAEKVEAPVEEPVMASWYDKSVKTA